MAQGEEQLEQTPDYSWLQRAGTIVVLGATAAGVLTAGTAHPAGAYEKSADGNVVVEQNDALWNIVKDETGISGKALVNGVHDVAADNHLADPGKIMPGQRLSLKAVEGSKYAANGDTYELRYGDTLWDIVKAHYGYVTAELVTEIAKRSGINMESYFPDEVVRFIKPSTTDHPKSKPQPEHQAVPAHHQTEPQPHATITIASQRQTIWDLSKVLAAIKHTSHEEAMQSIMAANPGMVPRELQLGDSVRLPGISDRKLSEVMNGIAHLTRLQQAVPHGSGVVPASVVSGPQSLVNKVAEQPTNLKTLAREIITNPNITIQTSPNDRVKRSIQGLEDDGATFTHDINHPGEVTVSPRLLQIIEGLAETHHITLTSLTTGNHVPNSDHYRGEAVDIQADTSSPEIFRLLYENRAQLGIDELIWAFAPPGTTTLSGGQEFHFDATTLSEHHDHIHLSVTNKQPLTEAPEVVIKAAPLTQKPKPASTPEVTQPNDIKLSAEEDALINSFNIAPDQKQFLRDVVVAARRVAQTENINPAVMVAQALNESDWGRKAPHFNYFGIKGTSPAGNSFKMDTKEDNGSGSQYTLKGAQFQAYNSPEEAFRGYVTFIKGSYWYGDAMANHDHWQAYLNGLQNNDPHSYATSIIYVQAISNLVREYSLDQLTHTQP